jgi:cytochrome b561
MNSEPDVSLDYGAAAKSFHWVIVVLLVVQFAIGWSLPHIGPRTTPKVLINLHLSVGTVILMLAIARFGWRLAHPVPILAIGPVWQQRLAHVTHILLYALLLINPVLGWMSASGRGYTVGRFGLINLPALLAPKDPWTSALGDIHGLLSTYALLGRVGRHVAAALYHHFVLRDRTLLRMLDRKRIRS